MISIFYKYRCLSCPDTPWLTPTGEQTHEECAFEHLTNNVGHELSMRVTSEEVQES